MSCSFRNQELQLPTVGQGQEQGGRPGGRRRHGVEPHTGQGPGRQRASSPATHCHTPHGGCPAWTLNLPCAWYLLGTSSTQITTAPKEPCQRAFMRHDRPGWPAAAGPSDPRADGAGGSCEAEGHLTLRPTREHLTSGKEPAGCSAGGWVAAQEPCGRAGGGRGSHGVVPCLPAAPGDHGSEEVGTGVAGKARAHV